MTLSIDPIRPYLPLVYGGAVLAVVIAFAVQSHRIRALKADVAAGQARESSWRDAQATNLASIDTLQGALSRTVERLRLDRVAAAAAVVAAQKETAAINARLAETKGELNRAYEKSATARAWGAAGVDADIARRLPK